MVFAQTKWAKTCIFHPVRIELNYWKLNFLLMKNWTNYVGMNFQSVLKIIPINGFIILITFIRNYPKNHRSLPCFHNSFHHSSRILWGVGGLGGPVFRSFCTDRIVISRPFRSVQNFSKPVHLKLLHFFRDEKSLFLVSKNHPIRWFFDSFFTVKFEWKLQAKFHS